MILVLVFADWGTLESLSIDAAAGETLVATRVGETPDGLLVMLPGSDVIKGITRNEIESIARAPSPSSPAGSPHRRS